MNSKQKFLNTINFKSNQSVPNWEYAFWNNTLQRWYKEGLPKNKPPKTIPMNQCVPSSVCTQPDIISNLNYDYDVSDYFHFDERIHCVAMDCLPVPRYDETPIKEDEETIIYQRFDGQIVKTRKDGKSMPLFLESLVKDKKDFNEVKERFSPDTASRFPNQWNELVEEYTKRSFPLQLGGGSHFGGFFSIIREMLGVEKGLIAFFDNPLLVYEILDFFTEFFIKLFSKAALKVEVDYIFIWEDLAFKNGPLISPDIFKKFMLPYYKKFIDSMKELGVKHFIVDTDGNFEVLIPLFLEAGVDGFLPFEVQAGMNIEKIREDYPKLIIMGGIDKMALAKGKKEIIDELKKVKRVIKRGGYIPFTDHMVPPNVSFDNYKFFREELNKILKSGKKGRVF